MAESPYPNIVSSHLHTYLSPYLLANKLRIATKLLRSFDFDTIAFRGMSGALTAPTLAMRLKKQMILVRKDGDDSHTYDRVEGNRASLRYIIVDDFVSTGKTRNTIIDKVRAFAPNAEFIGLLPVSRMHDDLLEEGRKPYKLLQQPSHIDYEDE